MYGDGGVPRSPLPSPLSPAPPHTHIIQHLGGQTVSDHKNGFLAGTNDLVRQIGGQPPTTLQEFTKNRPPYRKREEGRKEGLGK